MPVHFISTRVKVRVRVTVRVRIKVKVTVWVMVRVSGYSQGYGQGYGQGFTVRLSNFHHTGHVSLYTEVWRSARAGNDGLSQQLHGLYLCCAHRLK